MIRADNDVLWVVRLVRRARRWAVRGIVMNVDAELGKSDVDVEL